MTGGGTKVSRGRMGSSVVQNVTPQELKELEKKLEAQTRRLEVFNTTNIVKTPFSFLAWLTLGITYRPFLYIKLGMPKLKKEFGRSPGWFDKDCYITRASTSEKQNGSSSKLNDDWLKYSVYYNVYGVVCWGEV